MKIDNRKRRQIEIEKRGNTLHITCHGNWKELKISYHKTPGTKEDLEKFLLNSSAFYDFLVYVVYRNKIRMLNLKQEIDVFVDEIFEFLEEQKK